ncbi:MAG TPA: ABC transporter substrate-binding protein [Micromonosporaceae bacterium]|nr:ABC transporter substrate-binding protein [Micromonosporaceae bacterium]
MGRSASAGMITSILVLTMAIAGCGASASTSDKDEAAKLTTVRYLTAFSTFGREAYVYVAKELGYFKDRGLNVEINPGTGTVDVLRHIAGGTADIGIGDSATGAVTVANQKLPLKAVAAIQQKSMAALVALKSSGISKPSDLAGRTYADVPGSTMRILLPFYAKAAGFDSKTVKFVPSSPPDLPRLLASGKADVIGQFVAGRPLIEAAAKQPAVFFPYADHLPDLYGNFVYVRGEMIENEPKVIQRFLTALLRGLRYAIEHPEEAGRILARHVPEQDPQIAAREVETMAPYVRPAGFTGPVGGMETGRVDAMLAVLKRSGALKAEVPADQIVAGGLLPAVG